MNGIVNIRRGQIAFLLAKCFPAAALLGAALILFSRGAQAQDFFPPVDAGPQAPRPPDSDSRELEAQLRLGLSVATIQVDGNAATALVPGITLAYRDEMLLIGALFDGDPGYSNGGASGTDSRSGWHLGMSVGPAFELSPTVRFDLTAEFGLHQLQESISTSTSSYSTSASLPYFGVRPAISLRFGSGTYSGAFGAAFFFRLDAGQRQPSGLPDDGGHQLGAEAFLTLRIKLLSGN